MRWWLLGGALMVCLISDLRSRRIYDWVTLPVIALELVMRAWGEGLGDLERGALSGAVASLGAAGLFLIGARIGRGFGWGDVKLIGAVGATFGFPLVVSALVLISLCGAAQALLALLWTRALIQTLTRGARRVAAALRLLEAPPAQAPRSIPYGVAIAIGSFWAMWWERSTM